MSEFWVSKKKYFCKYCDIYIADDAPSRQQHENGLRHQGSRDRFIRGLYKEGERRKKDLAEEKIEMARVERAAQAAYAQDIGSGVARPSSSTEPSTSAPARKPPPKPSSNRFENYSTAASLGLSDPDAERIAAIALQKRMEGIAGQWEYVESSTSRSPSIPPDATADAALGKRPADNDDDDTRHFKLRKRNMEIGLGKIYDPGAITIKPKKKEEPVEEAALSVASSSTIVKPEETDGSSSIKWKTTRWTKAGEAADDARAEQPLASELLKQQLQQQSVKKEEDNGTKAESHVQSSLKLEETEAKPKLESEAVPPSSMFKKRKPPAAGTRGKRTI